VKLLRDICSPIGSGSIAGAGHSFAVCELLLATSGRLHAAS
jgi:hypothetical protein